MSEIQVKENLDGPNVTGSLASAMLLAEELHRGHLRKGTQIPYLSHLLAVCSLVLEDGGGEVAASGALLHDAAEDQGGRATLNLIREQCGDAVAGVVEECSDSLVERGGDKAPWRQRKEEAIANVPVHTRDALLVIAADKLHNARATLADLQITGPDVWNRFNATPADFIWYHEEMGRALTLQLPESRSVRLLIATTAEIRQTYASAVVYGRSDAGSASEDRAI